jgi:DNA-directed RNA polymerase specialized sigma24 family protein
MAGNKSITRNIIHDICTPKGYQLSQTDGSDIPVSEVTAFLGELAPDQFSLLHQYYTERQPLTKIAETFCCSEQTIKQRHQRLLHVLRYKFNGVYREAMQKAMTKSADD